VRLAGNGFLRSSGRRPGPTSVRAQGISKTPDAQDALDPQAADGTVRSGVSKSGTNASGPECGMSPYGWPVSLSQSRS